MKFESVRTESPEARVVKDLRNLQVELLGKMKKLDSKSDEFRSALESMQRISDEIKRIEAGHGISEATLNPYLQQPSEEDDETEIPTFQEKPQTVKGKLESERLAYQAQIVTLKRTNPDDPHIPELQLLIEEIVRAQDENARKEADQVELAKMEEQAGLRSPQRSAPPARAAIPRGLQEKPGVYEGTPYRTDSNMLLPGDKRSIEQADKKGGS